MEDSDSLQGNSELVILDVRVQSSTGVEASESILAYHHDGDHFRVARSPGFARGIAAADLVRYDREGRSLSVVKRGGNVCIQYFHKDVPKGFIDAIRQDVEKIGGWQDGELRNLLVFTIPVSAGFSRMEEIFMRRGDVGQIDFMYGNIYDELGRPLNWW